VEGIPTERYTFLKNNVELSRSEDKIGSQLAITTEVFNPTTDPTESGYSVARTEVSDVDGIPTKRFTFLKDDVQLSKSEDNVGSQLAEIEEWFNPSLVAGGVDRRIKTGYSLAKEEESDVGGIPTERYTFLKNNVELSRTEDKVGSQLAIVIEQFNGTPVTPSGYSVAKTDISDVLGIPTRRYTFLKNDVQLSKSEDEVGSQKAITEQWFKPAASRDTKTSYSLARKEESDVEGIPTERYTFLKNDVLLSESEDKVGSQKAIIEEWFNPDPANTRNVKTDYSLAREEISDISGIPTVKYTFLKPSVLSRDLQISKGGTIQTETVETFEIIPLTSLVVEAGSDGSIITISRDESNYEGIKTLRYVFVLADGQTRIRTRSGPPELAGSTIKTIVSVGTEAVESATGELIESIDELADGFSIFTREYLMPFDNETPLTGLKRTYSDSIKVRVPGAIQLQVVNVSIETVTGQEATVLDTPPSTQTISVDVEVSIETTDPARTVPPFDMGKIRCSLSMERMTHSYRGFQSYTSTTPSVIDQATGEVITQGKRITNYYPKQSVSSSASVRVYPERYLIGPDSLTAELKYQSQLNRANR